MLTVEREDHGTEHSGKFAAYVRVSKDDQDVANQEHSIKAYLNGGDHNVKWFREQGVSSGEDWHNRVELHKCLDYCRKQNATMVIYSISRMSRRQWETLRFFEQEVAPGNIKLVVVDDPTLDETTIGFKAMFAQHERTQIKQRTKLALNRIKSEIDEKGEYTSKAGNVIKKLGIHDKLDEAGIKGNKVNTELADKRAADVWPIIEGMLDKGLSYRAMARELNKMGVPTPTKRRNPDTSKRTEWYASSVRNYVLRMGGR